MKWDYKAASKLVQGWWKGARNHPWKALIVCLVLFVVIAAISFSRALGEQMAQWTQANGRSSAVIEFKNEYPFVKAVALGPRQLPGYQYRVKVRNTSNSTIHVLRWKLIDLQKLQDGTFKSWGQVDSVPLEWDSSPYIGPKDHVFVPFARIYDPEIGKELDGILSGDLSVPQLRLAVPLGKWERIMTSHIEPGEYRFEVIVSFENSLPAEAELELRWPGNHRGSIPSIVEEITVRKLR